MVFSKKLKWILAVFIIVGFIGFMDATFLTIERYNRGILPCYIFEGCDIVTASKYSSVFGIPISLFGAVYYVFIMLSAILYFDTKSEKVLKFLKYFPLAGFMASLGFIYLQLFVIKAICFYCIVSAITSTAIFISSIFLRIKTP